MAGALSGQKFHAGYKALQHIQGDKGLDSPRKAAAVDPAGAAAMQQLLGQGQQQGQGLGAALPVGGHILQVQEGGQARLADQLQKGGKVIPLQGGHLLRHPPVLLEEVVGPQYCTVAAGGPDQGQVRHELAEADLPQDLPAKAVRYLAHLPGNGGVILRQVGVAGPAVHNAQGVAVAGQVEGELPQKGGGGVLKVDGNHAADGAGHLVQQAAGLAEVGVLRILAHLGQLGGGEGAAAEEVVHDGGGEHLKGGRGAEPAAPKDPGGGVGVEAGDGVAQLVQPGGYAPDQGHRAAGLLRVDGEVPQIHLGQAVVAAFDADGGGMVGDHAGDGVQVHAGSQTKAILMVRVVAPQLRPPGGGEEQGVALAGAGEGLPKLQHQLPQPGGRTGSILAIDRLQPGEKGAVFQSAQKIFTSHLIALHPYSGTAAKGPCAVSLFYHFFPGLRKGEAGFFLFAFG